jgi:hypothetical protein
VSQPPTAQLDTRPDRGNARGPKDPPRWRSEIGSVAEQHRRSPTQRVEYTKEGARNDPATPQTSRPAPPPVTGRGRSDADQPVASGDIVGSEEVNHSRPPPPRTPWRAGNRPRCGRRRGRPRARHGRRGAAARRRRGHPGGHRAPEWKSGTVVMARPNHPPPTPSRCPGSPESADAAGLIGATPVRRPPRASAGRPPMPSAHSRRSPVTTSTVRRPCSASLPPDK